MFMGKHFESLQEIVEANEFRMSSMIFEFDIKKYLDIHLRNTTVKDVSFNGMFMQVMTGLSDSAYNIYLEDYLSKRAKSVFFSEMTTGIEDTQSYTAIQEIEHDQYIVTASMNQEIGTLIECGVVKNPSYDENGVYSAIAPVFGMMVEGSQIMMTNDLNAIGRDVLNAFTAYAEEAAYIETFLDRE